MNKDRQVFNCFLKRLSLAILLFFTVIYLEVQISMSHLPTIIGVIMMALLPVAALYAWGYFYFKEDDQS